MLSSPLSNTKTLCDVSTQLSQAPPNEVDHFCVEDPRHCELLREWSKSYWSTIKNSMNSYNPVTYHECCFCFSRRGFAKKAGHCEMQSVSVLKMPSLKALQGPDELYKWLLDRIKLQHRLGRKPIFPAINRYHVEVEDESEDVEKQIEHLGKRCDQLENENRRLRSENAKLLESSQAWCLRYQESLEWVHVHKDEHKTPEKTRWREEGQFLSN
jgi:hypothetical protein